MIPKIPWDSLAHRPLLWIAPAIMLGCQAGTWLATNLFFDFRNAISLFAPFMACSIAAIFLYRHNPTRFTGLLALCFVLFGATCTLTARRWLPPTNDASSLVRLSHIPHGPVERVAVEAQGWVASDPSVGDYNTGFIVALDRVDVVSGPVRRRRVGAPLAAPLLGAVPTPHAAPLPNATPASLGAAGVTGNIWVSAPPETTVQVGDGIILHGELEDLPHAGNGAERSPELFYIDQDCWCQTRLRHAADLQIARPADRYPLMRTVAHLRRQLLAHYVAAFTGPDPLRPAHPFPYATAHLLAAVVFGHGGLSEPLPRMLQTEFRDAGMAHVLVASGTQVVFLGLGLVGVLRLLGFRRWSLLACVAPVLLSYALIAGGGPSIWRATICGLGIVWAMHLGRDTDGLSLWALACAAVLLLDPLQIFNISFQLTFGATWGIIALSGPLHRRLSSWLGIVPGLGLASMSLTAQACTIPLVMHHFGYLSAAGIAASSVAIPLSGLLVGTGVLGLFLPIVNAVNYPLTSCIQHIAAMASGAAAAHATAPPLPMLGVAAIYLALLLLLPPWAEDAAPIVEFRDWARGWRERFLAVDRAPLWRSLVLWLAVIGAIGFAWMAVASCRRAVRVTLIDVGQGECILIRSPAGRNVLIDGGSSADVGRGELGRSVIIPYLQSMGITKIDAMIVTHADADHCNALPDVVAELPVGMALDGGQDRATGELDYKLLKTDLKERGIPIAKARDGQVLNLGDGVAMHVLAPTLPFFPDDNDNGAVLRLDYRATSMLFTADIEGPTEERLVRRGANLHCTVLKLGYHGSKTSSTPLLLDTVHPRAAILSCGRYNSFGHPAPATLDSLRQRQVPVYRTDINGSIDVTCDGRACWVQPYRGSAH